MCQNESCVDSPRNLFDLTFISPPWGGRSYLTDALSLLPWIRLGCEIKNKMADSVIFYLPRNINVDEVEKTTEDNACAAFLQPHLQRGKVTFSDINLNSNIKGVWNWKCTALTLWIGESAKVKIKAKRLFLIRNYRHSARLVLEAVARWGTEIVKLLGNFGRIPKLDKKQELNDYKITQQCNLISKKLVKQVKMYIRHNKLIFLQPKIYQFSRALFRLVVSTNWRSEIPMDGLLLSLRSNAEIQRLNRWLNRCLARVLKF